MDRFFLALLIAMFAVGPFYVFSRQIALSPGKQEKAKQKAIALGHVVQAEKLDHLRASRDDMRRSVDRNFTGIYRYEFGGKTYKTRLYMTAVPPQEVTLYFLKNPKRAAQESRIETSEFPWLLVLGLVALLAYAVL